MSLLFFHKSVKFLKIFKEVSPYTYTMILWKLRKSDMFLFNYIKSFFSKAPLCLQTNGKQKKTPFSFQSNLYLTKGTKQHLN